MGCSSSKAGAVPPSQPEKITVKDPPIAEQFSTMLASSDREGEISMEQYLKCPHTVSRMKTNLADLQAFREFFYEYDENHDGYVDLRSFLQVVVKMDMELVTRKQALNASKNAGQS